MGIADDAEETTAGVQKARLQVGTRQWLAERLDATSYGAKGGANVTINIGALMLGALRQPPPPRPQLPSAEIISDLLPPADSIDYETVVEESAS